MVCSKVDDGGDIADKESSCKYTEYAVTDI